MKIEIKRVCNKCGKLWYVDPREEQSLNIKSLGSSIMGIMTAFDNTAHRLNMNNVAANDERIKKLRQCPNCLSTDFVETLPDNIYIESLNNTQVDKSIIEENIIESVVPTDYKHDYYTMVSIDNKLIEESETTTCKFCGVKTNKKNVCDNCEVTSTPEKIVPISIENPVDNPLTLKQIFYTFVILYIIWIVLNSNAFNH